MKRGGPIARKPMRSVRPRSTGPTAAVVETCLERAQYCCEIHGGELGHIRGLDWSVHHRIPRGMGGSRRGGLNLPPAVLVVCGSGTTGCHQVIESHRSAAYRAGWLLHSGAAPAVEPVLIESGARWVLLTADGGYRPCPAPVRGEGYGESEGR